MIYSQFKRGRKMSKKIEYIYEVNIAIEACTEVPKKEDLI